MKKIIKNQIIAVIKIKIVKRHIKIVRHEHVIIVVNTLSGINLNLKHAITVCHPKNAALHVQLCYI